MDTEKYLVSRQEGGSHHKLHQLIGTWEGTTKTWFEPGVLADEQPMKGTIKPALDGRFVVHDYQTTLVGHECQGIATFGYHIALERFEMSWQDNCHNGTGVMFSIGKGTEDGFWVLGSYGPLNGPRWGWRVEIEIIDRNHITISHFNISPDGDEALGVETIYSRASK
jgi:hypothetical protein